MLIKILLVIVFLCVFWINFDNFRIKRKVTRLSDKVERLTEIAKIKCNLPDKELPNELKIIYLENQINKLESLILNRNYQDKEQKNTP